MNQAFEASSLPYLTSDVPGTGGRIKVEPEDFVVEELPCYEPCGEGEHLFLWIEKRDISGEFLLGHLSRTLRIARNDIGMAGLKDRRAVTRQYVSVPRSVETRTDTISTDAIRLLRAVPHANKLRTGHLFGNRFEILIRDVDPAASTSFSGLVTRLQSAGVPNYYGEQRFGHDRETLELGFLLLRGETSERSIPYRRRRFLLRLALSAVQSLLFNQVLAERLSTGRLHQVQSGDVLQVVSSGGCFVAEDVTTEQARFDRREIVLTGPMFGPKMKAPAGATADEEREVLNESGLTLDQFRRYSKLLPGTRRPMIIWPGNSPRNRRRPAFVCGSHFPVAYATVLLREIMKADAAAEEQSSGNG